MEDFFKDFDIADTPVFAKKSAPPNQEEAQEEEERPLGNVSQNIPTFPSSPCSTPSSSILDSSAEVSSNKINDEPMEQDAPTDQSQDAGKENATLKKKPRNRSRSQKNAVHKPNVEQLLAGLKPQQEFAQVQSEKNSNTVEMNKAANVEEGKDKKKKQKPKYAKNKSDVGNNPTPSLNPPLPPDNAPGSIPPPPPLPQKESASESAETNKSGNKDDRMETSDASEPTTSSSSSSSTNEHGRGRGTNKNNSMSAQRTSGRIPKIKDYNLLHTQGAGTSSSSPADQQQQQQIPPSSSDRRGAKNGETPGTSRGSAYATDRQKDICLDVTSHRFLPDDDLRIAVMLRKMVGDQETAAGCASTQQTVHDFPTVFSNDVTGIPLHEAPGSAALYDTNDDARFVVIVDFASVERPETAVFHTIARRESITFVLVSRPESARGKKRWEIPALTECQDYVH